MNIIVTILSGLLITILSGVILKFLLFKSMPVRIILQPPDDKYNEWYFELSGEGKCQINTAKQRGLGEHDERQELDLLNHSNIYSFLTLRDNKIIRKEIGSNFIYNTVNITYVRIFQNYLFDNFYKIELICSPCKRDLSPRQLYNWDVKINQIYQRFLWIWVPLLKTPKVIYNITQHNKTILGKYIIYLCTKLYYFLERYFGGD